MVTLQQQVQEAMWDGDLDRLHTIAGCVCCCSEHTFESCPARLWEGCRGAGSMTRADEQAWFRHYEQFHGMTFEQFYDLGKVYERGRTQ